MRQGVSTCAICRRLARLPGPDPGHQAVRLRDMSPARGAGRIRLLHRSRCGCLSWDHCTLALVADHRVCLSLGVPGPQTERGRARQPSSNRCGPESAGSPVSARTAAVTVWTATRATSPRSTRRYRHQARSRFGILEPQRPEREPLGVATGTEVAALAEEGEQILVRARVAARARSRGRARRTRSKQPPNGAWC
jgi:hypothetical protein